MKIFFSGFRRFIFLSVIFLPLLLQGQVEKNTAPNLAQIVKEKRTKAEALYLAGKYVKAFQIFQELNFEEDSEILHMMSVCSYHFNDLSTANKFIRKALSLDKKVEDENYYLLARILHSKGEYVEARKYYKEYLKRLALSDPFRYQIRDDIKRCINAEIYLFRDEKAYVENLGVEINTPSNENNPVFSPNVFDKIYFSSDRPGSTGLKRNNFGSIDETYGFYRSDIFSADLSSTSGAVVNPLGTKVNTKSDDILYDFSPDGKSMYYYKSEGDIGSLIVNNFDADKKEEVSQEVFNGPLDYKFGDKDLYFFNDSIMVFSSNRPGGYGGFDIYISIKKGDTWKAAINAGDAVNGPFDEVSPFLASDGRLLFFASNDIASFGGFDIFSSRFNDEIMDWTAKENLGFPINSGDNESHFKLSYDASTAIFNSDRKSGYGGKDLYMAYFKKKYEEHLVQSTPLVFSQVKAYKEQFRPVEVAMEEPGSAPSNPVKFREYKIDPLFYGADDNVMTANNITQLNTVANMLQIYPEMILEIVCHSVNDDNPKVFDLYFSVKNAEKVAQHLVREGANKNQLIVRGAGNQFPQALMEVNGYTSELGIKLNRKIDLNFKNYENNLLQINYDTDGVPSNLKLNGAQAFSKEGLIYKVELVQTGQMLRNQIIDQHKDVVVEKNLQSNMYRYCIGSFSNLNRANDLKNKLQALEFPAARIIAYIDGIEVKKDEILNYAVNYPDLLNYLENAN